MEKRIRVGCYGAKGSYTYEAMSLTEEMICWRKRDADRIQM